MADFLEDGFDGTYNFGQKEWDKLEESFINVRLKPESFLPCPLDMNGNYRLATAKVLRPARKTPCRKDLTKAT